MTYIHLPSVTQIVSFFLLITSFFTFSVTPVLAARTYTYDANGNMMTDGEKCYQYNENNQLKIVRNCTSNKVIADYIYDHNGKRIAKKEYTNGVLKRIVYSQDDGFEKVKLASNSAVENTTYYMANDEVVAKKNPDGSKTYFHSDHLGSNAVLTNQSGTVVDRTTYEPFGEVKDSGNLSKFQYTGQEKDLETGLNYYDARYYDSHIQRFTQADPMLPNLYDPQQLNRYSYTRNNPIKYKDPTGNYIESAVDVAFLSMDIYAIQQDPTNLWNWGALGADMIGTAVPFGTGFGLGIKTIQHGGDVKQALTSYTKIAQQSGKSSSNIVKSSVAKSGTPNNPSNQQQSRGGIKIAGEITGYTKHGINQVIGRDSGLGVSLGAIRDTVKSPTKVINQVEGKVKYISNKAEIVLNKFGKIVSAWAKSRDNVRK